MSSNRSTETFADYDIDNLLDDDSLCDFGKDISS